MSPLIAILWWLSLGAMAIGAFVLGYRFGETLLGGALVAGVCG